MQNFKTKNKPIFLKNERYLKKQPLNKNNSLEIENRKCNVLMKDIISTAKKWITGGLTLLPGRGKMKFYANSMFLFY